ncbi:MAG: hypothetical protein HY815_09410 [Candidatus Riflebacteria bacterium]|nr:hypothetical protein [Candidatus Riflebacteria bacterium]
MDRARWIEHLKTDQGPGSPFRTSTSRDPWGDRLADVFEINGQLVHRIVSLVGRFHRTPEAPLGVLLVGDVGGGKTHFLSTLCHSVSAEGGLFSFADIRPLTNWNQPLKHLLSEVVCNLNQRPPQDRSHTQLERIAARTIARFLRERYRDDTPARVRQAEEWAARIEVSPDHVLRRAREIEVWDAVARTVTRWLESRNPRMWGTALKVFFQYPIPHRRETVVHWLRGESPDDEGDLKLLGLKPDPASVTAEGQEEQALKTLVTLGHLLSYDRPLVVSFDQLENVITPPERLAAFGRMLLELYTYIPGMLPLVSARGDLWSRCRQKLDPAIVQRFESNRLDLVPCTKEQSLALIRSRLVSLGLPPELPPLFPLDEEPIRSRLEAALAAGSLSPRLVLMKADHLWKAALGELDDEAPPETPVETLRQKLEGIRQSIHADPARHPPDDGVLSEALDLAFCYPHDGWGAKLDEVTLTRQDRFVDLVVQVRAGKSSVRTGIMVDVEQNPNAVAASLRHGLALKRKGEVDRLVFVRDGRVPFPRPPRWPTTNALRDQLTAAGGLVQLIPHDQVVLWHALVRLHQEVRAQDVTYLWWGGQPQVVLPQHFRVFMGTLCVGAAWDRIVAFCLPEGLGEQILDGSLSGGDPIGLDRPTPVPTHPHPHLDPDLAEKLHRGVERVLRDAVTGMMPARKVYEELGDEILSGIRFETFLETMGRWPRVARFHSKSGVILKLKAGR